MLDLNGQKIAIVIKVMDSFGDEAQRLQKMFPYMFTPTAANAGYAIIGRRGRNKLVPFKYDKRGQIRRVS